MTDADHLQLGRTLAQAIPTRVEESRAEAFGQVLRTTGAWPARGLHRVVSALYDQLEHLPPSAQFAGFRSLLDWTRSRGEGARAASLLATHFSSLHEDIKREAFFELAYLLRLQPDDGMSRAVSTLRLAREIKSLPPPSREEATRRIVALLRPLSEFHRNLVLRRDDGDVSPAIKDALRLAVAADAKAKAEADLTRAGTNARA